MRTGKTTYGKSAKPTKPTPEERELINSLMNLNRNLIARYDENAILDILSKYVLKEFGTDNYENISIKFNTKAPISLTVYRVENDERITGNTRRAFEKGRSRTIRQATTLKIKSMGDGKVGVFLDGELAGVFLFRHELMEVEGLLDGLVRELNRHLSKANKFNLAEYSGHVRRGKFLKPANYSNYDNCGNYEDYGNYEEYDHPQYQVEVRRHGSEKAKKSKYWSVHVNGELLCVTIDKEGAHAVKAALEEIQGENEILRIRNDLEQYTPWDRQRAELVG